jgi:copper chaperone CopZ
MSLKLKNRKVMKVLLSVFVLFLSIGITNAQESKIATATIKTSAECGSCKERLEEKLNYTTGVKYAELNLENKELSVKYNTKKISLDEIRKIISETGYDADRIPANPEAVKDLPACCKPGGMVK